MTKKINKKCFDLCFAVFIQILSQNTKIILMGWETHASISVKFLENAFYIFYIAFYFKLISPHANV